jgi:divalent metal cation (Fe/Co/Zn/Cd) transporter
VFSLGGGLSIYHGIQSLQAPEPLGDPFWNYVVLGAAFLFEGYSWNVSRRALNDKRRPGASLWQTMKASKDASTFTVFIEDSAALIGIVIAAGGIFLGHLLENPSIDPAASIVIGVLLIGAAFTLARETGALLLGEGVGVEQTGKLKELFRADPAIETVEQLMTMQLGPDDVLLTAAVRFKRGMRIDEVDLAIARLERAVAEFDPTITRVYFEAAALRSAMR